MLTFFALYYFINYLYGSAERLGTFNIAITSSLIALKRIMTIFQENPEDFENGLVLDKVEGKIEFKNVSFSYDGKSKVLKNINIQINPGERVVITGRSGAGKTTLILLLLRLIDPDEGNIFLDGTNLKKINLRFLREQISYIPQEPFIFEGTIEENIKYGNSHVYDRKRVIKASRMASAYEFIQKLPKKFYTAIKEGGKGLSEGEKQRISIARALFKDSKILIFDEANSHLDYKNARIIQETLDIISKYKTVIIIAHRLSLVSNADKIYVIENGEVVERGCHKELLLNNGIYKELYFKQYSHTEVKSPLIERLTLKE